MADNTNIEWTDSTWNIITGCSVVSAGCKHCYAMKLAGTRLQHHPSRAGLTIDTAAGPVWNGQVRFNEQWLDQPLRWRRPRRIFVCAHGDLFHESVPDEWIDKVFAVMALAPQHTFQVLTKRAARMRAYLTNRDTLARLIALLAHAVDGIAGADFKVSGVDDGLPGFWLPNVWLGVSVENQDAADERIPLLQQTPAAVRWISAEPLLGPVDLNAVPPPPGTRPVNGATISDISGCLPRWQTHPMRAKLKDGIDWVVVGGESGPGARPMHPDWARSLRDQCATAGVPLLFKQWGEWAPSAHILATVETAYSAAGTKLYGIGQGRSMERIGKKAAGRLLDGVLHDAYPEVRRG